MMMMMILIIDIMDNDDANDGENKGDADNEHCSMLGNCFAPFPHLVSIPLEPID